MTSSLHAALILLALTFWLPSSASAQVMSDTARGLVGAEVRLALLASAAIDSTAVDDSGTLMLRGSILLSNPTVFYPERFVAGARTVVRTYDLRRLTDSTYDFEVVLTLADRDAQRGDTLCLLAGEALAGFDSTTNVHFTEVRSNDGPSFSASGVIVTRSIGTPLPYVRHATLEQGYPNPARRYQTVTWAFRLDKPSPVRFGIYNIDGELVSDHDRGVLNAGIHIERFDIGFDVATSVYVVQLVTNSGNAWTWMHVVK